MGHTRFHFTRPVAPNSPDLNPADYRIWGEMRQRLYQAKVRDIDELKQCMLCLARDLEQSMITIVFLQIFC